MPYVRNSIAYNHDFCCTSVKFHFFEILSFWALRKVKVQKMAQDDKKNLAVAVDILRTIYHIIVIYGTLV